MLPPSQDPPVLETELFPIRDGRVAREGISDYKVTVQTGDVRDAVRELRTADCGRTLPRLPPSPPCFFAPPFERRRGI